SLDIASLLNRLDAYPYGCAEQTVSKAMPLLYLSDLRLRDGATDADGRINGAVKRVLTFQSAGGSFGLWGPGSGDLWLDAYVSDFLTRAREKNYVVPEGAMRAALENLRNATA